MLITTELKCLVAARLIWRLSGWRVARTPEILALVAAGGAAALFASFGRAVAANAAGFAVVVACVALLFGSAAGRSSRRNLGGIRCPPPTAILWGAHRRCARRPSTSKPAQSELRN